MAKEFEVLDLFLGSFPSESAFADYLAETCHEDDVTPISRLAADLGQRSYDHDFIESSFHQKPISDLRSKLEPHSFSSSYVEAVATTFESASVPEFNVVLLVWGE